MAHAATTLPHETDRRFIADGGLETSLVFLEGWELDEFAAFPLLDQPAGRRALRTYYESYLEVARRHGVGIVVDTPTWRASREWGHALGWNEQSIARVNSDAVEFVRSIADEWADVPTVLNGVIGPRGDGYAVGNTMTPAGSEAFHSLQTSAFAEAGVDMITAVTMTYVEEAIGIADSCGRAGVPCVISFTVETDGRLPSGAALSEAILAVDRAAVVPPAYYMVNCAHPSHFMATLETGGQWVDRVQAIRANASRMSHEELDDAESLDRGDVVELATEYQTLDQLLPNLRMVGGCCGTDHEHLNAITGALVSGARL